MSPSSFQTVRTTIAARPAVQILRSTDIDEHAGAIQGWHQSYAQLSAGAFAGEVRRLALGGLEVLLERTNRQLRQRFTVPHGEIVVATPSHASGVAFWNGACLKPDSVVIARGGVPTELLTPCSFGIAGFAVGLDPDSRTGTDPGIDPVGASAFLAPGAVRVRRDPVLAAAVRRLCDDVVDEAGRTPAEGRAALARAATDRAAALAGQVLAAGHAPAEPPARARRLALVRGAEAFIESAPDAAPTVADLCRATGACRRTLQGSFVDVLGMGPSRYLRALRLNRARADLKRGTPVSEVAVRWGFWHFGRFASDYRALFGELPSATRDRGDDGA